MALSGSIHIALAHGLISGGLFYSIGLLYDRYHSRLLRYYRGLFFILANLSFPLFTPLLAELAIIIAYPSILQLLIISLNGSYSIWLYNRLFFGTTSPSLTSFNDISRFEFYTLFIILLALFSLWTLYLYFSSLLISLLPLLPLSSPIPLLVDTFKSPLPLFDISKLNRLLILIILYLIGSLLFILFDYSFIALSLVILYIGAYSILFYLNESFLAIFLILIVAFMPLMTLAERYLLASIHRRIGPYLLSLFIPFNDGLKLILKAIILPLEANTLLFLIAPLLSFLLALTQWLFLLLDPSILLFLALI